MNRIQRTLFEATVAPAMRRSVGLKLGTVREVDYVKKRITIAYTENQADNENETVNIDMVRDMGLHEAGPFEGDQVLVGFLNNNIMYPYIIGTTDTNYGLERRFEYDQHRNQGAYLSDQYATRSGETWNGRSRY